MKLWTAFAIMVFAVALVACTQAQQTPQQQATPQDQSAAEAAGNTTATQDTPATGTADAAAADPGNNARVVEINMTAQDFQFKPDTITVQQGDRVIIHIVGSDDDHGLAIQGYDQQVKFGAGQEATLDFIADKPGTFTFYCNVPCGPGHRSMRGQLIVIAA